MIYVGCAVWKDHFYQIFLMFFRGVNVFFFSTLYKLWYKATPQSWSLMTYGALSSWLESAWFVIETAKFRLPIGQLSQYTNRQSEFFSLRRYKHSTYLWLWINNNKNSGVKKLFFFFKRLFFWKSTRPEIDFLYPRWFPKK